MYIISRSDIVKFTLPPVLACVLFVITLFGFVLPTTRNNLLEQKKDALTILTQTAANILSHYYGQTQTGELPEETAQQMAASQLRKLRYGADDKDYFWINDLQPRMIMHPYRPDLEGKDLGNYTDPNRKKLFVEFVETVSSQGSGFVPYHWQWKDIPDRIAPKLSYVRLFEPWGWVIGTGVYLDDVNLEFKRTSRKLILISGLILAMITGLSGVIIRQGLLENRKRRRAEKMLMQQNEQLEHMVRERTAELENALSKVKRLSGFLPICASCKKIRDDRGYWNQIESYIREHSEAEFSHGICPECMRKLYPGLCDRNNTAEKS